MDRPIFLVGPTPRDTETESWRPYAVEILESFGWDGDVLIPERRGWNVKFDYIDQVEWEKKGIEACHQEGCVAAWVPRDLETMPAFTTNVEFGLCVTSGRFVYGRPDSAPNNRYLDWLYCSMREDRKPYDNLHDLMRGAMKTAETDDSLTEEQHMDRHVELHRSLDELIADFFDHNHDKGLTATLHELMKWSCKQTTDPDTKEQV